MNGTEMKRWCSAAELEAEWNESEVNEPLI
jgi:hypothetical protein